MILGEASRSVTRLNSKSRQSRERVIELAISYGKQEEIIKKNKEEELRAVVDRGEWAKAALDRHVASFWCEVVGCCDTLTRV